MLIKPTKEALHSFFNSAYELSLDLHRSGYPTYADGIKGKKDFEKTVWAGFHQKNREQFLFQVGEQISGLIQFFLIPEDHYLQTEICSISQDLSLALEELEAYCVLRYPDYDFYWGFPSENRDAISYLDNHGWNCSEASYHGVAYLDDYQIQTEPEPPVKVTKENYADFALLCREMDDSVYWNSVRLYKHLDEWSIWLAYDKGIPAGAVYYTTYEAADSVNSEIFGVLFADGRFQDVIYRRLLRCVLNDCKCRGLKSVVYFYEAERAQETMGMGFSCVGNYNLYTKRAKICV